MGPRATDAGKDTPAGDEGASATEPEKTPAGKRGRRPKDEAEAGGVPPPAPPAPSDQLARRTYTKRRLNKRPEEP